MRRSALIAGLALAISLAACGGSDPDPTATEPTATEPTATEPTATEPMDSEPVAVTAIDYAYEGIPAEVDGSVSFTFTNASEGEVHEMVVIKLPDDEERPITELLALPEEDQEAMLAGLQAVTIAMPGEAGFDAVGELSFSEPGRYAVLCAIQVGADPEEYMAESQRMRDAGEEGPVMLENAGPPHFTQGMFAEFVIN